MPRISRLALLAGLTASMMTPASTLVAEPGDDYTVAFERLRSLAGTWDAVRADDEERTNTIRYHVTAAGAVVFEEFLSDDPDGVQEMATAYHMDVDDLMLTHYCGAGNQPRMRAVSFDPESDLLSFDFMDVTDVSDPDDYYTTQVEILFQDDDHVELRFAGVENGEPTDKQVHLLTRRVDQ